MDDQPKLDETADDGEIDLMPRPANDEEIALTPREIAMVEEAEASLAAGFYADGKEVFAWLDSIGTAHELPPPPVRQRA